jgi:riboflavin synthase alpha subunit
VTATLTDTCPSGISWKAQRLLPCGAHHLQKGVVAVDVVSLAVEEVDPLVDVAKNFDHEQWIGRRDPSVSVRKDS